MVPNFTDKEEVCTYVKKKIKGKQRSQYPVEQLLSNRGLISGSQTLSRSFCICSYNYNVNSQGSKKSSKYINSCNRQLL